MKSVTQPGPRTLVVCAGMPRSGSTWLFNAARLLMIDRSENGFVSGWLGDLDNPELIAAGTILIKIHRYEPVLVARADKVLYSYRDLRDVMASRLRKDGKPPDITVAERFVGWDRRWKNAADYVMRYETMKSAPLAVLDLLARRLSLAVTTDELVAVHRSLDALSFHDPTNSVSGHGKHHPDNLLHPGHVTDGRCGSWRSTLHTEAARRLEHAFADWFVENNYPL